MKLNYLNRQLKDNEIKYQWGLEQEIVEELIKLEKFPEATTKFNEVIKKDPLNTDAKKQLDIIKGLIAAKTSQAKDVQELIKLKSILIRLMILILN